MAGHAGKEETVEGHAEQPIQTAPETARAEGCGLDEAGFLDAELQPGFAGEFHFGKEHEAALGADRVNTRFAIPTFPWGTNGGSHLI